MRRGVWTLLLFSWAATTAASPPRSPAAQEGEAELVEYRIGPGDVLKILVWKEEDFSGDFTVRLDGRITMPLVGDVLAAGVTPEGLAAELEKELGRYVELPRVTVVVTEANSKRFFVIGKVANQGAFPYIGPIRVVQAIALAGGFQEFAKLDRIFVMRESGGKLLYYPVNYDQIEGNRRLAGNIPLLPGDTIVVP